MRFLKNNLQALNKDVIAHFKLKELACRCGKCTWTILDRQALYRLATVRTAYGRPMNINRMYSCQQHNRSKRVGGSKHSRHCIGQAIDIAKPAKDKGQAELLALLKLHFPYIKNYKTHWHVDMRSTKR